MNDNISKLESEARIEIEEIILPFWISRAVDHENGGFYGEIDSGGNPVARANKGVVLNARILWAFSAAYRVLKKRKYLEMAERAYYYLINYFKDNEYGGYYWMLDCQGKLVDTKKQVYAQGFVIYGLTEYFRANHFKPALDEALELYTTIEKYSYDPRYLGYIEACTREWKLLEDMRLSAKDENEKKSMNTHLHILEPYTNLYRIYPNEILKNKIIELVNIFLYKIMDQKSGHLNLFFDDDWSVKSDLISFGHDIEASWLMTEAAEVVDDTLLTDEFKNIVLTLADKTLTEGTDSDHSIYYEANPQEIIDDDKHWWVQGEAMIGYINAFQLTGNEKYMTEALMVWDFIQEHVSDKKNGEWHKIILSNGKTKPDQNKVDAWKCPYHNSRTCMEIIERSGQLIDKFNA